MVNPHDKLASYTLAKSLKFVDDHCVVGMPWKSGRTLLLDNNSMVLQRLRRSEGKLKQPPKRGEAYKEVLQTYQDKRVHQLSSTCRKLSLNKPGTCPTFHC